MEHKIHVARDQRHKYLADLVDVFMAPKSRPEMRAFLEDFLSPTEIKQLVERYHIGDQLLRGMPQRNVKDDLKVSITKVSRASYMLKHGIGGFYKVWRRLQKA